VTFRGIMTTDAAQALPFELSLRHREWATSAAGVALRPANHLCAIRRVLASARPFPEVSFGEDRRWAESLRPLLRTELAIPHVLYHYRLSPADSATQGTAVRRG
jgi:hypothetical protein